MKEPKWIHEGLFNHRIASQRHVPGFV
uniref:Translation initiation factor 1 n=1 Tax=Mitchella repens TaxID=45181 RepID=A0A6F8F598_MITRE|nr:translation initiation factor 1 [Mitchella repens]